MLGQISAVRDDGTAVRLPSVSQRRLLGFLASRAGQITSVSNIGLHLQLTDGAVRTGIARLRRQLGGPGSDLVTEEPGYVLASDRIDALRFERALVAATSRGVADAKARASLQYALGLWHGDAYAELAHEPWAVAEAIRLDELRATATETLVDVLLALAEPDAALELAMWLIDRHPFRDRPRGQQMRALAAMGRVTESLRAFQDYRAQLIEEVGTLPSSGLADLEQQIATGRLALGATRRPPVRADAERALRSGVVQPRSFTFGLELISRQVAAELTDRRLVTLTGIGGIGKTRLALTVIGRVGPELDRVVFVDLRSASSTESVGEAVARAAGVETNDPSLLIDALRHHTTLLALDGCEHVLAPAAVFVEQVLAEAPSVHVLATSRQALGATGEHVQPVPLLSPDDATALFLDRASRWRDRFAGDDASTRQLIAAICERLDRIPLAIELAAACVAHMTLTEIDAQLDDRLTFLPDDPLRQQRTLRATMDWSYELLDDHLQALMRALSVFAVDLDAAAAAAVWGRSHAATLAGLGALVRASLVVASFHGETTRYELLETVRLHAGEKASAAGETERLRGAHAGHYARVLGAIDVEELLRPVSERRPDLANHERMLEVVASGAELSRLGEVAWRVALAHRAECWTDRAGRYLGREDVVAALAGLDRACYLAASFENANVLGRWSDQLEFADMGLESATGPVRVALLRGAASACSVLAPARVAPLIDEAMALVDPADIDVLLELRRTKVDALLLAGDLEVAVTELRVLWDDFVAARIPHDRIRPLAGIDLLWVNVVLGQDGDATALADELVDLPGGEVAAWCARAIVAARAHRRADSATHLLLAAAAATAQGVPLVDNDVTAATAIRAAELGEPERACRLLASLRGGARSPGAHQLLRHARDLVHAHLDIATIRAIRLSAGSEDPSAVAESEVRRLRAEAHTEATTTGS